MRATICTDITADLTTTIVAYTLGMALQQARCRLAREDDALEALLIVWQIASVFKRPSSTHVVEDTISPVCGLSDC